MRKRILSIVAGAVLLLLLLIGAYELIMTPEGSVFSETENRILAARPDFTVSSLLDGSFSEGMDRFLADQFPGRDRIIHLTQRIRQLGSLATWEDYSKVAENNNVEDMQYQEEPDEDVTVVTPRPTRTPAPVSTVTPAPSPVSEQNDLSASVTVDTPVPTATPLPTATPRPTKPPANVNDFPAELRVDYINGSTRHRSYDCMRYLAQRNCTLFDAYASLLPEDGIFALTLVPYSPRANRLLYLDDPKGMVSELEPFINAVTSNNVAAFSAADQLSDPLLAGEYVFFRSDMHWTPYGAHMVVKQMLAEAGENLPSYESFPKTQEYPFLGTLYRDTLNKQMEANPDTLDIVSPIHSVRVRRYSTPEQYDEVPFICEDANPRDRYSVYLGGSNGNWTVVERTDIPEDSPKNTCLLIADSYGLCTMPFFAEAYDRAILYDPRFYDKKDMGSVADLIESWGVQDIYLIIGDYHFSDEVFFTLCNRQF